MMLSRRNWLAGAPALAAVAAAPLGAQTGPAIALAASSNDSTTSAVYAVRGGLFKNAGLNVQLSAMGSGAAVTAAVAGGSIQFGASSLLNLISAHSRHLPFVLVASAAMYDASDAAYVQLVVRKDAPFKTARDLNGKTVAVPGLKDLNTIGSMAWIDQNGGDSSSVRFIELSPAASVQALAAGRVDATVLATPFLSDALETGVARTFADAYAAIAKQYLATAWFTTEDYASRNRDVVARFARVMRDAAIYCNAHQADTVDLIAQFGGLDPNVVRHMARAKFAPTLTPALIQPLIDVAAKYRVIDAGFAAQELISPYALVPNGR